MSDTVESDRPLALIETNREMLKHLAESDLPISRDAQRALELVDEEWGV